MPSIELVPWGADLRVVIDGAQVGLWKKRRQTGKFEPSAGIVAMGVHEGTSFASPRDIRWIMEQVI